MKKILLSLGIILAIALNVVYTKAASYNFNFTGPSQASKGETVTLTVTGTGLTGNVLLSATNAKLNVSSVWVERGTATVTATINNFPATITATPSELSDDNYDIVKDLSPKTVTITEKVTQNTDNNSGSNQNTETTHETPNKNNVPTETKKPETPQVTKSSNNYLSGITVGTGKLSPEFYRETFDYTVEFDDTVNLYDLKEIEISATAEDYRATVEGTGTINLQDGENNITLTVKAENGSARTYNIKVVKPMAVDQSSLRLKTLVLNGINASGEYQTINLEFNPETFEYNITVPNDITSISVNPTTENEDIIIESNGGENLNEGENKIIIILTSPSDDTIKTTYTINIERQAALTTAEEQGLTNKQLGIVIISGVVGLILLIAIIIAIVKHRKKKKGFGYDDDDEDNEIHFINNEEGEDVKDYDEVESPYPDKIVTSNIEDNEKDNKTSDENDVKEEKASNSNEKENKKDDDEELKFKTTYDEENIEAESHAKSKWDDFVDGYQDEEENKKSKKKKHGRRFL